MSIDKSTVLSMSLEDILKAVKDPATSQAMQRILPDRDVAKYVSGLMIAKQNALAEKEAKVTQGLASVTPPSTEALATEAQAMVTEGTPETDAPPVPPQPEKVDTAVEDAALKAIGVVVQRDAQGKITQAVIEYQVVDEENKPIGRPTRLWAPTLIELLGKVRNAHENATRAFHRLKIQKLTFEKREQDRVLSVEEMKAIATKALEAKDATEAEKIVRNLIATEFSKKDEELREQREHEAGVSIGNAFLRNHIDDFFVCEANNKALGTYLKEHRLEFTLDNLEAAFVDLKEQGALVERKTSTAKSAEPTPNASATATGDTNVPASTATPAQPNQPAAAASTPQSVSAPVTQPAAAQASVASQPGNEATVTTPATANTPHVARRPVVSGVMPGSLSAQRPGTPDPALARKEFMKTIRAMDPKIMAARLKNDPQFVKQCEAYGIRTR